MPRSIPAALQEHLDGEVTSLALCWRIRRRDGTEFCHTDHDREITYEGRTYAPAPGQPGDWRQGTDLSAHTAELALAYPAESGLDAMLRSGLFDAAEVWTFFLNWENPGQGIVRLSYGRLGEVEIRDNQARIEFRSLAQQLAATTGRIYAPECDATLGDRRCTVDLAAHTHSGAVSSASSRKQFVVSGAAANKADGYYAYGQCRFTSGACSGMTLQIERYAAATNQVTLLEPMPFAFAAGDTVSLTAGCDRRWETCKSRFANKDNFRGFPHIPGMDRAVYIPGNVKWTEA